MAGGLSGPRFWVWAARLSSQTRTRHRAILGLSAMALVVLVLGVWGWLKFASDNPGVDIGLLTAVYRSVAFFAGEAAEPYDVGWQLDVARMVALLAVPSGAFVAAARIAKESFMRRGARHATGHIVLVGSPTAADAALAARGWSLDRRLVVQVDTTPPAPSTPPGFLESLRSEPEQDRIWICDPLDSTEWIRATNADRSRLVVIAGGPDLRTVRLVRGFLDSASPEASRTHVVADLTRWETAQWLDLNLASRCPDASVEVGCVSEAVIVDDVAESMAVGDSARRPIAVAGRSEARDVVVRLLVRQLTNRYASHHSSTPETLHLIDLVADDADTGTTTEPFVTYPVVSEHLCLDAHHAQLQVLEHAKVFLVEDDPDRLARLELRLETRFPHASLHPLDSSTLIGQHVERIETHAGLAVLRGPAWTLAPVLAPGADVDVDPLDPDASTRRVSAGRRAIAALGSDRHRLIALEGSDDGDPDLTTADAEAIAERLDIEIRRARNLRFDLVEAGYDFDQCRRDPKHGSATDSMTAPDVRSVVPELAQLAHEAYLDDADNPGGLGGWDELDDAMQHSNIDLVLHHLFVKLPSIGMTVVPGVEAPGAISEFTTAQLEPLAIAEHERWSRHKRRQGWTWGPERDETQKHHEFLVPWAELDEPTRSKDRTPLERLPRQLRDVGWSIVPIGGEFQG